VAFNGCIGLSNVVLQEGVTGIGMGAFAACTNLKSTCKKQKIL